MNSPFSVLILLRDFDAQKSRESGYKLGIFFEAYRRTPGLFRGIAVLAAEEMFYIKETVGLRTYTP
jgi:hypothetical protein